MCSTTINTGQQIGGKKEINGENKPEKEKLNSTQIPQNYQKCKIIQD